MNHEYVHCSDCTDDCPEDCFRAQLTRDLEKINDYNLWITWAHLKGIGECLNPYNEMTGKKEKQKMDYKIEKYKALVNNKIYDDMSSREFAFCVTTEIDYYRDKVNKLREEGVSEYKISAYIYDLWQDYLIADDVELAEAYNISDEDWAKGLDYWWYVMDESNPLKD